MTEHFEQLWEEAEKLNGEIGGDHPVESIIDELIAKLTVYKVIEKNDKIPQEEKLKLKTHTFGKILSTLTHLSLRDNVNTFIALKNSINDLKIDQLEAKYR